MSRERLFSGNIDLRLRNSRLSVGPGRNAIIDRGWFTKQVVIAEFLTLEGVWVPYPTARRLRGLPHMLRLVEIQARKALAKFAMTPEQEAEHASVMAGVSSKRKAYNRLIRESTKS